MQVLESTSKCHRDLVLAYAKANRLIGIMTTLILQAMHLNGNTWIATHPPSPLYRIWGCNATHRLTSYMCIYQCYCVHTAA